MFDREERGWDEIKVEHEHDLKWNLRESERCILPAIFY
jgi:hypothetical protein